jgi:hypothetical protein
VGLFDVDVDSWEPTTYFFNVLAVLYVAFFLLYWVLFQRAEKAAKRGDPGAAERFNEMLRGFPNAVFAKMFGKKPYEVGANAGERSEPPVG